MVHLFGFNIAQQILIASGAIFQVGAYYIFTKECAHARLVEEAQREREEAEAEAARREELACESANRGKLVSKVVKYRRHVEGVMEHVPEDIRPADLARTAKVRFKHSLEAYQGETQAMPPLRRDAGT